MKHIRTKRSHTIDDLIIGDRHDEIVATIALVRAAVISPEKLSYVLDAKGSAVEIVQRRDVDLWFTLPSPYDSFVGVVSDSDISKAYVDLYRWLDQGLHVTTVIHDDYPVGLHEIFNRPPILFFQGAYELCNHLSVAIVGARKATPQGIVRSARMAAMLGGSGFTIVSGLAAGIDTAAHESALRAGVPTYAVVGTGLNHVFPKENVGLASRIIDSGGCLVSQFFPEQPPTRWTFPKRNVVMSGLTKATVVIEASETSGAKMQAGIALEHGRTVFLLRSLVNSHKWAHEYVTSGKYGTVALQVSRYNDIVDRLTGHPSPEMLSIA